VSQDRDFVLELDGLPGSYRLHLSSPAGEDSADIGFDPASLGVDLDTLQAQVLASATRSRALVPELERPLRRLGQALFEAVFQASAGALFLSSRNEVERAGGRLRIVLRLHPPELAVLPWELLFSDHYGGYLCRRSPMVRYVSAPEPVRPLTVDPPLRVLGMTALPGDLAALDADSEQRRLQQTLAPLQARGLVAVDWVPGQSWEAVQDALYAGCQVFHFIGHGGFDPDRGEGVIAFADERGRRQLVGASALAELLSVADPVPRLVVLNSCQTAAGADTDVFSSTAATLVRTVPAVVAMQFAVTDDAAATFSRAFYQALVNNRGVDEAVRAGRIALTGWNADTLEWVTPVLYLRSRDTRLFDLTQPGAAPARADDQPQPRRQTVMAAYWAAQSTGDWEPVIAQLGALHRQLPGDQEVEQAYQDARLAARYKQGRRAEQDQDWSSAVAHYQAVSGVRPEYRDVAARLSESRRRRDIASLQEQLRVMFTAGEFQAVAGIADRLAELDPGAADPDGLASAARQQITRREEAERAAAQRQQQVEQLHQQIRDRAAAQDWDAVVAASDRLAELDPTAADPDGLASAARQQITRREEAERAAPNKEDAILAAAGQLAAPGPGAVGPAEETGEDAPPVRVDKTRPSPDGNEKTQRRGIRPARLYFGIAGAIALASLIAVILLLATHSPGTGTPPGSSSSSSGSNSSASSSSPNIAALSGTLNGSGSTLQLTFQQAAISSLKSIAPNLTVNYSGGDSGKGRTDLASGVVSFAGSAAPIPAAEQASFQGKTVLYFPVTIDPITVSYNLSGLSKPLQLSAPVLANIFEGRITAWNNSAILALNPGVTLPSQAITIGVRSDPSDTTQNFSEFLVKGAGSTWTLGSSSTIRWPATARAGHGNGGVTQIIKSTPGAIGYVDYADAKASGLSFASIKNQAGNYVAPSPRSATAAAENATVESDLTFSCIWALGAQSYPVTYQSWDLVFKSQPSSQAVKNLQGYIGYLLGAGQQLLTSLGYASLPSNIDQMAKAQLSKIGM
jgi:phosphate ABC transporter phosphate-binding protein